MARFSTRTAWDTREDDLTQTVRELREAGSSLLDLTVANPTVCGFDYDQHAILSALQAPQSLIYEPDPRGLLPARQAVAGYYAEHAAKIGPEQIMLTTSTSEAYSFLLRLLCNPGDAILTAQPGYPLFDFLATLDDVVLCTYPLFYDFGWWIDLAELECRITPRTRALVLVHPNNPTGHATGRSERAAIEALCVRHHLALIVDEVFLDYPVGSGPEGPERAPIESFARGPHPCLTFVVSGLSKICALPQMKAAWIAVFGPEGEQVEALTRLEVIADTFLSLNAPVQHALPSWLANRSAMSAQVRERVRANLATLTAAAPAGIEHLPVEAGWVAIVRFPSTLLDRSGSGLADRLLRSAGVLVHPGSFYGLTAATLAVISLIVPAPIFAESMERLRRLCTELPGLQPPAQLRAR